MSEHLIQSPKHGELRVLVDQVPVDEQGRGWRARLVPPAPRLEHVVAAYGVDQDAAVAAMVAAVERYEPVGMVRRGPAPPLGWASGGLGQSPT